MFFLVFHHISSIIEKDFFSFFHKKNLFRRVFFHSAFALTFTAGLSYLFGFVRDRLIAQTFGAHATLDVYNASFVLPDFLLALFVTSCISTALLPIYTQQLHKDKERAREYFYTLLLIISSMIIALAILMAIIIPYFTPFLIPGFSKENQALYILMVRIMLLSPILFAFSNFFGGILLSTRDFFFYGIAPFFYNIGIVLGLYLFVPTHGIIGLAWGTVLGALLHLFSRFGIAVSRVGTPKISLKVLPQLRKTFLLMLPKIFQLGAWQVLLAWFIFLASQMPAGSITIYSLARNFQSMPVSLLGIALSLSAYAMLSHFAAQKRFEDFRNTLIKKSLLISVITIPISFIIAFGSFPLIKTIIGGGAFDITAVTLTATLLSVYAISIPLESMMHLFARAHYAMQHTLRPSLIHIFAIAITIIASYLLRDTYGLRAIPLAFALGLIVQDLLLILSLKKLLKKTHA